MTKAVQLHNLDNDGVAAILYSISAAFILSSCDTCHMHTPLKSHLSTTVLDSKSVRNHKPQSAGSSRLLKFSPFNVEYNTLLLYRFNYLCILLLHSTLRLI